MAAAMRALALQGADLGSHSDPTGHCPFLSALSPAAFDPRSMPLFHPPPPGSPPAKPPLSALTWPPQFLPWSPRPARGSDAAGACVRAQGQPHLTLPLPPRCLAGRWAPASSAAQQLCSRAAPGGPTPVRSFPGPDQTQLCGNRSLVTLALQNFRAPSES